MNLYTTLSANRQERKNVFIKKMNAAGFIDLAIALSANDVGYSCDHQDILEKSLLLKILYTSMKDFYQSG